MKYGELCELGSPLRPHIVWFGEPVPLMEEAYVIASTADILVIIGTSLNIYPAAGPVDYVPDRAPKYFIDPKASSINQIQNLIIKREKASIMVPKIVNNLLI